MKTLSILICTIPAHHERMKGLLESLNKQPGIERCEILIEDSAAEEDGGPARGWKRNMLIYKARGEYIAYVDADDRVSDGTEHPAYVPTILDAISTGEVKGYCFEHGDEEKAVPYTMKGRIAPDCIGITGEIRFGNDPHLLFFHSMRHSINWWDDAATAPPGQARYYRTPNHLNPVRREIAMKARFMDTATWSEDHDYGRRLHKLIRTEVFIPTPIYYYIKP